MIFSTGGTNLTADFKPLDNDWILVSDALRTWFRFIKVGLYEVLTVWKQAEGHAR